MEKIQSKDKALVPLKVKEQEITEQLLNDIRLMIEQARQRFSQAINSGMVLLYWNIGKRIRKDILKEKRAGYGEQILATLSRELTLEYGRGFTYSALTRMIRFAGAFTNGQIVVTLSQQLSWSHFVEIISFDDPLKRDFYAEMCRIERWSVRILRSKIDGMLYERTAISKKPAEFARQELQVLRKEDRLTPDLVFRDPYLLDFLGLKDTYSERDIEAAILRELEKFLLEIGTGFTFVARQKRITIDSEDYYLDLLFYHRGMHCLVAIELKLGKFKAADKGQMELYLRWLDKYERREGENSPLGLILCAEKSTEHVELLQLAKSGIRVAEYFTELPPRELLKKKLHEAIRMAREQIAAWQIAGKDTERS